MKWAYWIWSLYNYTLILKLRIFHFRKGDIIFIVGQKHKIGCVQNTKGFGNQLYNTIWHRFTHPIFRYSLFPWGTEEFKIGQSLPRSSRLLRTMWLSLTELRAPSNLYLICDLWSRGHCQEINVFSPRGWPILSSRIWNLTNLKYTSLSTE